MDQYSKKTTFTKICQGFESHLRKIFVHSRYGKGSGWDFLAAVQPVGGIEFCKLATGAGGSMKVDNFTRILLTIIAVALSVIALRPFISAPAVSAQAAGFGSLVPVPEVGLNRYFMDMRTGNEWKCRFQDCKLNGHYPLEQIK